MKKIILLSALLALIGLMYSPALASGEEISRQHSRVVEPKPLPLRPQTEGTHRVPRSNPRERSTSGESVSKTYAFGNPAGCSVTPPNTSDPEAMLANVQMQLGETWNLSERRQTYIWNAMLNSMVDVTKDSSVYEFIFNEFQSPFTYKGDEVMTIFVQNGFAVWFRSYGNAFRLMAIPMNEKALNSIWGEYLSSYWTPGGIPSDDTIYPVSKKLPCHWMIDEGWVSNEDVQTMFSLDWHIPDFRNAGQAYLAENCSDAYRISREKLGYWDATSMCGPLTWQIIHDANGFPYRIGSYDANANLFISANPRYWYGRPWNGFDPETYDLVVQTDESMIGYDFASKGNLYPGDIVFSYGSSGQYLKNDGSFSHIFVVTHIGENRERFTITNMVQNIGGAKDCFIREVRLYTPGDTETGVINYEWNNHGFGITGHHGFDVFRWKWVTYHIEGHARQYTVRWGDTLETIAFDWKISPEKIAQANGLSLDAALVPGQKITLPAPDKIWN